MDGLPGAASLFVILAALEVGCIRSIMETNAFSSVSFKPLSEPGVDRTGGQNRTLRTGDYVVLLHVLNWALPPSLRTPPPPA